MKAEDEDSGDEDDSKDSDDSDDEDSSKAEGDPEAEGEKKVEVEVEAEEQVLVTAAAAEPAPLVRYNRQPPRASLERTPVVTVEEKGTSLVAAGGFRESYSGPLDARSLAELQHEACAEHGPAEKNGRKTYKDGPHGKAVFDGPTVKTAAATFEFPEDHVLTGSEDDVDKIRAAMPEYVTYMGQLGRSRRGGAGCLRRSLRPAHPDLLDAELRDRGRAGVGCASRLPRGTRRRERPHRDLHRGHRRRHLLHLGGRRRPRWHLRNQVLPGPGVPGLHGDGGADHRPLPRVREPERTGMAREDRARERAHDGGSGANLRGLPARPDQGSLDQRHQRRRDARCPDLPGGRDREVRARDLGPACGCPQGHASGRCCRRSRSTC